MELTGNRNQTKELKINAQRVGELMQVINRRKITTPRFRFNMSEQDAVDLLAAQYQWVVQNRRGDFKLDNNTQRCIVSLAKYITQPVPKFGVMFCGSCGNGKTTLLYALQSAVNFLNERRHFKFIEDIYTHYKVGFQIIDVRYILQVANDDIKFKDLCNRDMLGIDDMGKEPAEIMNYGTVMNPVIDLLEQRYQRQAFTAITTNLTAKDIKSKYGTRISDRFKEMLEVIVFQDIGYRDYFCGNT